MALKIYPKVSKVILRKTPNKSNLHSWIRRYNYQHFDNLIFSPQSVFPTIAFISQMLYKWPIVLTFFWIYLPQMCYKWPSHRFARLSKWLSRISKRIEICTLISEGTIINILLTFELPQTFFFSLSLKCFVIGSHIVFKGLFKQPWPTSKKS